MTPKSEKNIRVDEAAEILTCSDKHIYRLIAQGHLKALKIGRARGLRIIESSVYDFIARQIAKFELENGVLMDSRDPRD